MAQQQYSWKAVYRNGSVLEECNGDGSKNRYGDIDRKRLCQFQLVAGDGKPKIVVHLSRGQQLIYRMRVACPIGKPWLRERVYIVGWHENRGGVNMQQITVLFEDGHVEVLDRFREDTKWFYPVNLRPEERM